MGSRPLPASPGRSQASVQGPRNNARVFDEGGEESGSGRKLARALLLDDKPRQARRGRDTHMGIIGWIIFGLIVGAVAKFLMPGPDPGGWIVTILLGIAGALVGGFLGRAVGWYGPNDAAGFLMSLVGALVLLGLYRLTLRRRT